MAPATTRTQAGAPSARTYVDHAATTPMREVAIQALGEYAHLLNPGGQYASGRQARKVLEQSRETIAGLLGAEPIEVMFCASGTEADNLAVGGYAHAARAADARRVRVVASRLEHPAVARTVEDLGSAGFELDYLPVSGAVADIAAYARAQESSGYEGFARTAVATCLLANNETGALQPVDRLVQLADNTHAATGVRVPVHTDAVQAVGHVGVDFHQLGVTSMAASAHKFGGPRGVGLLLARRSPALKPILHGGGQERGLRPGTVDVAGAAATAAALQQACAEIDSEKTRLEHLRDDLIRGITTHVPDVLVHTPTLSTHPEGAGALPGHCHISIPGAEGDSLIMLLDMEGFEASTGSACSSGVNRASEVLLAMGVEEKIARSAIRFTLGRTTTEDDVNRLISALPTIAERARLAGMA